MIRAQFQLTDEELKEIYQLNDHQPMTSWRILLYAFGCYVPGLTIAGIIGDWVIILAVAVIAVLATMLTLRAHFKTNAAPITSLERERGYGPDLVYEKIENSESAFRYGKLERWSETDSLFVFHRMGFNFGIPRRVFQSEELDTLRGYFDSIGNRESLAYKQPVELYERIQQQTFRLHKRFRHTREDMEAAYQGGYLAIDMDDVQTSMPKRISIGLRGVFVLAAVLIILVGIFNSREPWNNGFGPLIFWIVTLGIALPLLTIYLVQKWFLNRRTKEIARLTDEFYKNENELYVGSDGWYWGQPNDFAFYSWLDLKGMSQNKSTILLNAAGVNHVFHKRIFGSAEEALRFINLVIELRQEALRREEAKSSPTVTAVESGNPYQSPQR